LEQVTVFVYLGGFDNGGWPLHEGHEMHSEQYMEVKQYNNSNQGEHMCGAYFVIPVMMHGSEYWCLRKEDKTRIGPTGGGDELAGENAGEVQKKQDTGRG